MASNNYLYSYSLVENALSLKKFQNDVEKNFGDALWLGTNFRTIAVGDWLWINLTKPENAIVAVAEVVGEPFQVPRIGGRWQVEVEWKKDLSRRLFREPISVSVSKQTRQGSPRRVVPELQRVLNRWLAGNYSSKARKHDEEARRVRRMVLQRQGQPEFRRRLINTYGAKCMVTGCAIEQILQAAHIVPVSRNGTHRISNGLLLRADIHNLFDLGLLAIDEQLRIHVAKTIRTSEYRKLHGKRIQIPTGILGPSKSELLKHFREAHP
jgi:hypothetical protein